MLMQMPDGVYYVIFLYYEADVDLRSPLRNHTNVYSRRRDEIKNAGRNAWFTMDVFANQADDRLLIFASHVSYFCKLCQQCLWQALAFHGE